MAAPAVLVGYDGLFHGTTEFMERLRQEGFEVRLPPDRLNGEAETVAALQGYAAVIAGSEPYTERVLASLPELRVVSRAGVGYDCVDLEAATRHRVVVTITPGTNQEAVAEHTLALILALARSIPQRNQEIRRGKWSRAPYLPLRDRTLGIVGLGRIGKAVAVRAAAFRMHLLAYDPVPDPEFARAHGIELVDLDTLLARSDYVSLHLPLMPGTAGIINQATLARMKPGSFLINTSRGGLVVEADVLAALQSGHLAGAGLDVFEREPTPADNPLLQFDNVITSPHMGGGDTRSLNDIANAAAQNIIDLHRGDWPEASVLNPAVRPGWRW